MKRKLQILVGKLKKKGRQLSQRDKKSLLDLPSEDMQAVVGALPTAIQQSLLTLLEKPAKLPIAPPWLEQTKEAQGRYPILEGCSAFKSEAQANPAHSVVQSVMVAAGDSVSPDPQAVAVLTTTLQTTFKELSVLRLADLTLRFPSAVKRFQALRKKMSSKPEQHSDDEEWLLADSSDCELEDQERLEFNDQRTQLMTAAEYQAFTASRRANFLSLGRKAFLAWIGKEHLTSTAAVDLLGYIVWDYAFRAIEEAVRTRSGGSLQPLSSHLTAHEVANALAHMN